MQTRNGTRRGGRHLSALDLYRLCLLLCYFAPQKLDGEMATCKRTCEEEKQQWTQKLVDEMKYTEEHVAKIEATCKQYMRDMQTTHVQSQTLLQHTHLMQ